jgi:hypothetical protein
MHQLRRVWFLLLPLAACGGGDTTNDDGGTDATQGSDAASDVVVGNDAGSDTGTKTCVPIEGGLPCDGTHIACGALLCDAGAQICCINDGGAKETCTIPSDAGKPPPNACTGTKMACDEAADCPSGQICCGFVGSAGGFATTCQTSCGTGLQFCHGSAECVTGQCTLQQQCHGVTIETCSSLCP